ncbi:MAG: hypothetical protein LUG18_12035 [Candidatus Azobacteroides sp.]|nr:hypothetical protein [Candidatus Azobacteroides sp.]
MPYCKSSAREEFELELERLKKLAKKTTFKSAFFSYDHEQLIYQSCIFLLCARIEDYTKNLIDNILYNYRQKGAILSELPENARTKALIDSQKVHFKNFYNNTDEKKLIESLRISNSCYKLILDNSSFKSQINSYNIISTNKYPSIKNLKILYHRIGIQDIVKQINIESKKDLKTAFESFLSLRESIAHQNSNNLTFNDIERHFFNVKQYINYIDRIVYKHICKNSKSLFWK